MIANVLEVLLRGHFFVYPRSLDASLPRV